MADIATTMRNYLTTYGQITDIQDSLKDLRKELRDQGDEVQKAMIDASLSVVRIMQHSTGAHDILLNERICKKTISPPRIREILQRDFADRRLDSDSIDEVVAAFESVQNPTVKRHIKVKRLKQEAPAQIV